MKKIVLLIGIITVLLVTSVAFAAWPSVKVSATAPSNSGVSNAVGTVLSVAQWIGFIVAIAMVIWVGVKYLTAGAGTKAQVKSTMIPILVGAFLVALAPTIAVWIFNSFSGSGGSQS